MTIYIGNAHKWLNKLPEQSVDCVVTSPPYYGLRSYVADDSPLKQEEIGLEETPEAYIENMVQVFRGIRRVLKDSGTAWLNLGDTYSSSGNPNPSPKHTTGVSLGFGVRNSGMPNKQLLMIPHRVAIALQADGWWVRSDIVWHKPNPMPESVKDRPTKSKEYVFLLTKSERYFYDADAIREEAIYAGDDRGARTDNRRTITLANSMNGKTGNYRNKRDVWTIATKPYSGAHFATMPQELAETCIKAGCPETVCIDCGAPYVRDVDAKSVERYELPKSDPRYRPSKYTSEYDQINGGGRRYSHRITKGFIPTCDCDAETTSGLVLDPFGGAGTTALAAIKLGRKYQLIELNAEYVGIAQKRIQAYNPMQPTTLPDGSKQLSLFSEAS